MFDNNTGRTRSGNGITRRDFVKVGGLSWMGLGLTDALKVEAAVPAHREARARSVILLFMDGGPSQYETFDPKPEAPSEIRGTFGAISSTVDGVQVSELMPNMARRMHRVTLIRTLQHRERGHERACHQVLTGWPSHPARVHPCMGSVVARELGGNGSLPAYVAVPNSRFAASYGQAGYLETSANPFSVDGDPNDPNLAVRDFSLPGGLSREVAGCGARLSSGYDATGHSDVRRVFDLNSEPDTLRDTYGRTSFGQGCLLARRLVEAGTRFVTVALGGWDTHADNFTACRERLVPTADRGFSALLDDLGDRGLLDTTLVVWMGEFGRTPQINVLAGRDHWTQTGCVVLAGAGVPEGQLIGATDQYGMAPVDRIVRPEEVCATVYQRLGINYRQSYDVSSDYSVPILDAGEPLRELG